jgi:hypothetical protein
MHHHHHHLELFGAYAFFIFGLLGSLHCLGMCGPLSTLFLNPNKKGFLKNTFSYHLARSLSYGLIGLIMGYFGWHLQKLIPLKILIVLAALPLFLYIFGFMIPVPKFLLRFQSKIMRSIQNVSTFKKSVFIGFLSPALPCGLLYSALGASVAAPNPLTGSFWMMMFALGTIPLMVLSQISIQFGFKFIPQKYLQPMTKALALTSLFFLIWFGSQHI